MAKRSGSKAGSKSDGTQEPNAGGGSKKRAGRLESRLADLEKKESKLARRLDRVHERQVATQGKLAAIRGDGAGSGSGASARAGDPHEGAPVPVSAEPANVTAFCLREKRRVEMADPHPTVLRNGRAAVAGTCSSCGAKLVALVSSPG